MVHFYKGYKKCFDINIHIKETLLQGLQEVFGHLCLILLVTLGNNETDNHIDSHDNVLLKLK